MLRIDPEPVPQALWAGQGRMAATWLSRVSGANFAQLSKMPPSEDGTSARRCRSRRLPCGRVSADTARPVVRDCCRRQQLGRQPERRPQEDCLNIQTFRSSVAAKVDASGLTADATKRAGEGGIPEKISGIGFPRRPQQAGGGGTDGTFLLRTACVSSVPTESSHTASATMLSQFKCRSE